MEHKDAQRVVVVGGGVAGSVVAKSLQFLAHVTLVDPKEYFEIPWACLRSMVEPSFAERSVIKHREYFTNGDIVISAAADLTESEVITADGRRIPYDYLVIATGHADPTLPTTLPDRLNQYVSDCEKIKAANSVLIVGGGPTGVELAGEIAVDFPEKKVTLVHNGPRLMEFVGPKASDKTLKWFESKKVDVKLEQRVDLNSISDGGKTFQTSVGDSIEADCHFLCTAKPLGTAWLKDTMLKDQVDGRGAIKVDDKLRVMGHNNIFAIGDITDIPEIKQGFFAHSHADVVVNNLKLLMKEGKENKMKTYKAGSAVAIVSLGRKDAVAQLPFATVSGRFPGLIKSGDLFVGKTRKQMGLHP
ncbi:apoptosis-inducing factor-like protein A-like [Senna tora]|uniref:Apoptosis-inducing factor-like protein A-like n=1 Tax=Senna tora TaxID=362788 RepID=A0A834TLL3_9FABA|nr:apoptosis-inducing factor-like protein A-like [Senna tora]